MFLICVFELEGGVQMEKRKEQDKQRNRRYILTDEEQERQLKLLNKQIIKHKDMFVRLKDK